MPTAHPKRRFAARPGSASKSSLAFLGVLLVIGTSGCVDVGVWGGTSYFGPVDEAPAAAPSPPTTSDPEAYTETIPGTVVTFEMVPVPVDSGQTSEEETLWFGETEVTWDAYDVFVYELDKEGGLGEVDAVSRPSKPYVLPGESFGHQGYPALGMTFKAAQEYARWLSARTGKTYRLPTEAEWEAACRLGQEGEKALEERAWYWDNADDQTHPAGSLAPNATGLHDLLGNAAEWALAEDGTPVVKGGSWYDGAEDVGCEARQTQTPAWNATDPQLPKSTWWLSDAPFVGFRLVRERSEAEE